MSTVLLSWVGTTDIRSINAEEPSQQGALANIVHSLEPDRVLILNDYEDKGENYLRTLQAKTGVQPEVRAVFLNRNPMDFGLIYRAAREVLDVLLAEEGETPELIFNTSSGTWAMSAVWLFLNQMLRIKPTPKLVRSSIKEGIVLFEPPFAISADFLPDRAEQATDQLEQLLSRLPPSLEAFSSITRESDAMKEAVAWAEIYAKQEVTILIQGESGTGKELFAHAIHQASPRSEGPFVPINCGAIPENLVEAVLFGHAKGAFTGATQARQGAFEEAKGGTLFLDEVAELPLPAQVKLLRVLQQGTIQRVGEFKERKVDARIIAATHRSMRKRVRDGHFREDLFYRLYVLALELPSLRQRGRRGISTLIDLFAQRFNQQLKTQKRLTPEARDRLLVHPWPGNVRELEHTMLRLMIRAMNTNITEQDVERALLSPIREDSSGVLDQELGNDFRLEDVLDEVSRHYILKAWKASGGRKGDAAELLGLSNYQKLTRRMEKLGLDP
jgi:DNA-binding NtrC family response regulator